jgi:predicted enzyme related to lactoylglutathione lyase
MGIYLIFSAGGPPIGGMISSTEGSPRPYWLYYFTVDAIDAAIERIKAGGGTVLHGPHEVPGGAWIVNAMDPQGAMFALVAGSR